MMEKTNLKLPGMDDFFTAEALRVLRTNLQFCGQDIQAVALTSCDENEGKTVVTLQLAKSFSELGKRVLVIDSDMRKSVMAGRNAMTRNPAGLSEVLTGLSSIGQCVYATQFEGLHIMFAGKFPPNPAELLAGKYFQALVEESRKYYDYIFVDTAPLGKVIDAALVAQCCDGSVLVMGKDVRYNSAREVVNQLKRSGRILGVVRNMVPKGDSPYYR